MSGLTPNAAVSAGATLDQLVDHALERDGGHGAATAEQGAAASYTAGAQRMPDRAGAPGHISILA